MNNIVDSTISPKLEHIRAAITEKQIKEFNLVPNMTAKESNSNYHKFVNCHGQHAYELEALKPDDLSRILRDTIDNVINYKAYQYEREKEIKDSVFINEKRQRVIAALKDCINE